MSHLYAVALAFAVAGSAGAQDPGRAALQGQPLLEGPKEGSSMKTHTYSFTVPG